MNTAEAKQIAREWVQHERSNVRGYQGAFFIGSTTTRADDAPLPKTSDVDLCFCLDEDDGDRLERLHQYFAVQGIIIDRSARSVRDLQDEQTVLRSPWLACHFAQPSIIDDPSGRLTPLQKQVASQYAQRRWLEQRCAVVAEEFAFVRQLLLEPESNPLYSYGSFGPAIALAELLLVADLRNPTVGKGLVITRGILEALGEGERHEELLTLSGCAEMDESQVRAHFEEYVAAHSCAARVWKSYVSEDYVTNPAAHSTVVAKVEEMIDAGDHREAIPLMVYTRSVCQKVIENDAPPAERESYRLGFQELQHALGLGSPAARIERAALAQQTFGRIHEVAQLLMQRHSAMAMPGAAAKGEQESGSSYQFA